MPGVRSYRVSRSSRALMLAMGLAVLSQPAWGQGRERGAYTAVRHTVSVDGMDVGVVRSVEGGTARGVVMVAPSATGAPKKHIGNVSYDDLIVEVTPTARPLLDWAAASWTGGPQRKNVSVVAATYDGKAVGQRDLVNALITETSFPAIDGASKDALYVTVKLKPELVRSVDASGPAKGVIGPKQKMMLASNFRFEMGDLDAARVYRIEPFTVRQQIAEDATGAFREAAKQPGRIEFPNLKVTIAEVSLKSWADWHDSFVVKGMSGDEHEKNGAIVMLDPTLKEEMLRINLFNCGIFSLAPQPAVAGSDAIRKVTAELYCERMELAPSKSMG